MKLKNKKIVHYKGEVIDLCVENSHTYNVEGIAVHNSGAGSLVVYVLYITDLDPIKWELPFSRFLSIYREGAPDIDCVHSEHYVLTTNSYRKISDIAVDDYVIGGDYKPHKVTAIYHRPLHEDEFAVSVTVKADDGMLGHIVCVPKHKFVLSDDEIIYCENLKVGDKLKSTCNVEVIDIDRKYAMGQMATYVDITVEDNHKFHVIPFDLYQSFDGTIHKTLKYPTIRDQ